MGMNPTPHGQVPDAHNGTAIPGAAAEQLFIPAGWNKAGGGNPPLYTAAQVAALTAAQADSVPAIRQLDTDEVHGAAQNLYWGKQPLQDAFERGAHWGYRRGVSAAKEAAARDPADSVLEDAARWQWLADYLIGERTDLDEGIVACATIDALRQFADAARKQGANHD